MSANGIAWLETKEERQLAKLAIAQAKRQGKTVAEDGTISGPEDSTKPYYRVLNDLDISLLPNPYNGNDTDPDENPNSGGLVDGRPWLEDPLVPPFTNPAFTLTGVTTVAQSPFVSGNSYSFDGAGTSTIVSAGSADWAFGSGDFTVEWFQYQTDSNSFPRIFHRGAAYPNQEMGVSIEGGTFYGWFKGATGFGSVTPYKNAWIHFAVVRSGSNLKVYKNGTQQGSTSANSVDFTNTSYALTIGRETGGTAGTQFGGYMTNFRWVKGLAVYTGDFTVPTSALTATASANPYGGSNTAAIGAGYTKLLLVP